MADEVTQEFKKILQNMCKELRPNVEMLQQRVQQMFKDQEI